MLALSTDGKRITVTPGSPTKLREPGRREEREWETTLDAGADWEGYIQSWNDDRDEPDSNETEVIYIKPAAKRYPTSDAPMREWTGYAGHTGFEEEYLHELLNKWNGIHFERTSLKDMGLRMQLGHAEMVCVCPASGHVDFIVIHTNAIHRVAVDFCDCDSRVSRRQQILQCGWYPSTVHSPQTACTQRCLEHFLIQTCASKVSAYEYYQSLEHLTDNLGLDVPKSRYKAFMRMENQFRHLKILKRAGCGNILNGCSTTQPGELAISCPACPQPGINLPDGWENVDPRFKFLYTLILAMDANFRLKNRMRSSEAADPGLHTGLAYFLPEPSYKAHVLNTCSGFKTLAHAESKFSTGLQATGVGLCLCARHEFVRANGVGDLQKGERYCNMDYIFFSALAPLLLLSVVISYDIACQWKVNVWERMKELPEELQVPLSIVASTFVFGIPKFHCPAHEKNCAIPHSLNLMPGVGRTDGEGIERNWSEMNRVANSTKEMGPGSRHDTLDDHFGHHNWRKYVSLGLTLRNKLMVAIVERDRQQAALDEFNRAIEPRYQSEWTSMIVAWELDKTKSNPYTSVTKNFTEAQVRAKLTEDEKEAVSRGRVHPHETTPSAFIALALVLEESQRCLRADVKLMSTLTHNQQSELHRRRMALYRQIRRFHTVQNVYMVGMDQWVEQHTVEPEPDPENLKLWLPSELDVASRERLCAIGIVEIEIALRNVQCHNALDKLHSHLRTKSHYIHHRNTDVRGQRPNTCAHALINRITTRVTGAAAKYDRAREALVALQGCGSWEQELRPPAKNDICSPDGSDVSIENTEDVIGPSGRKKSKKQLERSRGLGQGRKVVLWIWTTTGVLGDGNDTELNEALHIEWAKSQARALRWKEEAMLLKEEMRWVCVFLLVRANWWEQRSTLAAPDDFPSPDIDLNEGLSAYAFRQASIQRALCRRFTELWENVKDTQADQTVLEVDMDGDRLAIDAAVEEGDEDEPKSDGEEEY
ncbi:hypothetical protein BJ138DRAFT_1138456 [Hygrophoropsis aurantiaca]|uniref:Uncharacterized protein n=1 Tax=Hygrophoropsis aurantiaca TaxID=72124 RepID=A0ACB7ZUP5_9AGAM|nr:hypothetical protein BJ138DRAFT_1138456 [Hygrophoropsis aurantiaca]